MRSEQLCHILKMFLVPAKPVHILNNHYVDLARTHDPKQFLQPRTLHRGAGDPLVAVEALEVPSLLFGIAPCCRLLILHRGGLLIWVIEAETPIADCHHRSYAHWLVS